jgi:hypothetical protein
MNCGIVLVRHLEDAQGEVCGEDAPEQCVDCGTALCSLHAESCDICRESFCASCCYLHEQQPHAKPVESPSSIGRRTRSA